MSIHPEKPYKCFNVLVVLMDLAKVAEFFSGVWVIVGDG